MPAPARAGRLAVRRLVLTEFRCYRHLRLAADERPVVLTGPNGAGKTNLLEALSFLAPGRGLRRARLADVTYRAAAAAGGDGARRWAAAATLSDGDEWVEIGTGLGPGGPETDRRTVKIDGCDSASQSELGERVDAVWLTPEMERLFAGPAADRRRFLDRLVNGFDPTHARRLAVYERRMRQRTRLLNGTGAADGAWIAALERGMAEDGVAVAAARRRCAARLDAACAGGVGPFPAASLSLVCEIDSWLAAAPALEAEERFRAGLAARRRADAEAGRATLGIHRSDLACRDAATDAPARLCSTGEQKSLLVRIVLANTRLQALERGRAPILLLDEIAAHLDPARRAALFEEVDALGAQAWMTGTDEAAFRPLGGRAQFFRVADAAVTPAG